MPTMIRPYVSVWATIKPPDASVDGAVLKMIPLRVPSPIPMTRKTKPSPIAISPAMPSDTFVVVLDLLKKARGESNGATVPA
jgi:hypothetical protein